MPNWCQNHLTVTGATPEFRAWLEKEGFSFEKMNPPRKPRKSNRKGCWAMLDSYCNAWGTKWDLPENEQREVATHPPRHRTAILVLVEGGTMREAGKRCGIKDSAALNLKRRIAVDLIEFFGEDVIRRLLDGVRPGWESDLRTVRDRHLSVVATAAEPSRVQPRR